MDVSEDAISLALTDVESDPTVTEMLAFWVRPTTPTKVAATLGTARAKS